MNEIVAFFEGGGNRTRISVSLENVTRFSRVAFTERCCVQEKVLEGKRERVWGEAWIEIDRDSMFGIQGHVFISQREKFLKE